MKYLHYNLGIINLMKNSVLTLLILLIPCILLAFININHIYTKDSTYHLILKEENSGILKLELTLLENDQYTSIASNTINTGLNHYKATTTPLSLKNNQVTDKIILIIMDKLTHVFSDGSTEDVNNFSSIYMMDADLQNINEIISISPSILISPPIFVKNNNGVYIVFGLNGGLTDTVRVYKLDTTNNSALLESANNYDNIMKLIPLDENLIIVVENSNSKITANIYSISKDEIVQSYLLQTDLNLNVSYDAKTFETHLISDLDNINITNSSSPYGIIKIH